MTNSYNRSMPYERFIRLARLCERDHFGAQNSHMQNLIDKEEGHDYTKHISYARLLMDLKMNLIDACNYGLQRDITTEDKRTIRVFISLINNANNSEDLLSVCAHGVTLFLKYQMDAEEPD